MSTQVTVTTLPACDFCQDGTLAEFDFATVFGPWANGCQAHFEQFRAAAELGTGRGQRLVLADEEEA